MVAQNGKRRRWLARIAVTLSIVCVLLCGVEDDGGDRRVLSTFCGVVILAACGTSVCVEHMDVISS